MPPRRSSKKKKESGASIESSIQDDSSAAQSIASPASADDTPATSVAAEDVRDVKISDAPLEDLTAVPDDKLHARLKFLIQQSSVFASIIGDKMEKQQLLLKKERISKEDKSEEKAKDPGTNPASLRKTRTGATAQAPAPARGKKRGKPASKKGQPILSDYISKDDLKSTTRALADAADADGETKLGQQKDLKSARQPKLITGGVMKDYQLEGLDWLVSLYENGLNGILADEMGLGKTLQTISFLAFLREKGMIGPFLVAAPVSTLANWVDEIEKFAPEMPAIMYHGTPAEREELRATEMKKLGADFPIICTSYEMIMKDRKYLQKYSWKFIVIDEGHRIKNLNCRLIRELKSYTSANRLLLTGTPLQNNLSELWSLLNFLLPDIFDDLESFQGWFDFSALQEKEGHKAWLEEERKTNLVGSLHAILKPFLLRRIKADVASSLPPKREYILYAPLTQSQKDLYGKLLDGDAKKWLIERIVNKDEPANDTKKGQKRKLLDVRDDVDKRVKTTEDSTSSRGRRHSGKKVSYEEISDSAYFKKMEELESEEEKPEVEIDEYQKRLLAATKEVGTKKLQNLVMQLRQACNSPFLFYWPWADAETPDERLVTESGKMMLLDRLVPALFARGHKVLIFSQFTKTLDIIEDWASLLRGWEVCRIDGKVQQEVRREQIAKFNSDPEWKLFLLSTRAGGLGINLTSADTVILFDSDWNPQQDLQAQDRAHRIGQKRPVIIYRFATAATVEQTLLDKADAKRRLERLVIQNGKFKSARKDVHMEEEELSSILLREDFEKMDVVEKGQQVLSEEELEVLLDRSPEAYEKALKGEGKKSGAFRVVEMKKGEDV
ncbi:putative ATPase [Rhizina undulata]